MNRIIVCCCCMLYRCTRWECEAMVWVKREEMKRPKKLSDDLQASLYVDFNFNSAPQPHHKQLFIPSSLYETRGLEIVDWSLLRTTSNSALKSRGSGGRCGEEEEDRSIVTTIIGVTEEGECSRTFSEIPIIFLIFFLSYVSSFSSCNKSAPPLLLSLLHHSCRRCPV